MSSSILGDYLGRGVEADLPAPGTPSIGGTIARFYWATDTKILYALNEAATAWDIMDTIPEAPIDANSYLREGGAWVVYSPYTDEQVRDVIGTALVAGTGIGISVDDPGNHITINSTITQYTDEMALDAIGAALVAGTGIGVTVNDAGDTITLESTVTQYTDEMARDAIGATLVAGSNVTLTVNDAGDTITIDASPGAGYSDEQARDAIGAALVAGSNITITVNDPGDTITIASTAGSGYTDENARDAIGAALVAGTGIGITVNDPSDTITVAADPEYIRDTIGATLIAGSNVTITVNDAGDTITIAAGAASSDFVKLGTVTAAGGETTLSVSSIPATCKHLMIKARLRMQGTTLMNQYITINGDTGNNYAYDSATENGGGGLGSNAGLKFFIGNVPGTDALSGMFAHVMMDIFDYTSTTIPRNIFSTCASVNNSAHQRFDAYGAWLNTSAAMTSIQFLTSAGSYLAGSMIDVYGLK